MFTTIWGWVDPRTSPKYLQRPLGPGMVLGYLSAFPTPPDKELLQMLEALLIKYNNKEKEQAYDFKNICFQNPTRDKSKLTPLQLAQCKYSCKNGLSYFLMKIGPFVCMSVNLSECQSVCKAKGKVIFLASI